MRYSLPQNCISRMKTFAKYLIKCCALISFIFQYTQLFGISVRMDMFTVIHFSSRTEFHFHSPPSLELIRHTFSMFELFFFYLFKRLSESSTRSRHLSSSHAPSSHISHIFTQFRVRCGEKWEEWNKWVEGFYDLWQEIFSCFIPVSLCCFFFCTQFFLFHLSVK